MATEAEPRRDTAEPSLSWRAACLAGAALLAVTLAAAPDHIRSVPDHKIPRSA